MKKSNQQSYNNKTDIVNRYAIMEADPEKFSVYDLQYPSEIETQLTAMYGSNVDENTFPFWEIHDGIHFHENGRYYLYAELWSDKDQQVIIGLNAINPRKCWLNGEILVAMSGNTWLTTQCVTKLNKGKNIFVVELFKQQVHMEMTIVVYNYETEMTGEVNTLRGCRNLVDYENPYFVRDPEWNVVDDKFHFMVLPADREATTDEYSYTVSYVSRTQRNVIYTKTARYGEKITLSLEKCRRYKKQLDTNIRHIEVAVSFTKKDGAGGTKKIEVFPLDCTNEKEILENELKTYLPYMPEDKESWFSFCLSESITAKTVQDIAARPFLYWRLWEYADALDQIHNDGLAEIHKYIDTYQYTMKSELDGKDIILWVRGFQVDHDAKSNKRYPLYISLSTAVFNNNSKSFPGELFPDGVIHADISVRGLTGGGYVGEASFFDMLKWINQRYNIDYNRIYLIGFCNGGHAALHMAQMYPHMFAGIYALSGNPEMLLLRNLSNIPFYVIASENDHVNNEMQDKIEKVLGEYGNFHQYKLKNIRHEYIHDYMIPEGIIAKLSQHKRNEFPDHIDFITRNNRSLKAYWITLGSIKKDSMTAHVKADILSPNHIAVFVKGADSFSMIIPPQIQKNSLIVTINGKDHEANPTDGNISFIKKRSWGINNAPLSIPDYRKGNGILDVYLNSLRIVIPSDADDEVRQAALNMSRPKTMTYEPDIYVSYPIYESDKLPQNIFDHNLIVFNDGSDNMVGTIDLSDNLPIKCTSDGYRYKDETYTGSYCIMQVIANPFDAKRSILVVSCNDNVLLKKILFFRRFILPFASSGYHEYLDNMALLYTENGYRKIFEWDGDVNRIKKFDI